MQRRCKACSNADKARELLEESLDHAVRAAEELKADFNGRIDRLIDDRKNDRYLFTKMFPRENVEGGGEPQQRPTITVIRSQPAPRLRLRLVG